MPFNSDVVEYDVPGNKTSLFHARLSGKDPIPRVTVGPGESGCDFSVVLRDRQNGEAGSAKSLWLHLGKVDGAVGPNNS